MTSSWRYILDIFYLQTQEQKICILPTRYTEIHPPSVNRTFSFKTIIFRNSYFEGQILNCILESPPRSFLGTIPNWQERVCLLTAKWLFHRKALERRDLHYLSLWRCTFPKTQTHYVRDGKNHRCTWFKLGRSTDAFGILHFPVALPSRMKFAKLGEACLFVVHINDVLFTRSPQRVGKSHVVAVGLSCDA